MRDLGAIWPSVWPPYLHFMPRFSHVTVPIATPPNHFMLPNYSPLCYNMAMQNDLIYRFRTAYWALIHNADALRLHVWEEQGVTLPQLRILFALRSQSAATTSTLAKLLGLTAPTVSAQVDKLVRTGLIARGNRAEDRRIIPLQLTEAGREVVSAISQTHQMYLNQLADDVGDDLPSIMHAMECLATAIAIRPAPPTAASAEERNGSLTPSPKIP